MPERNILVVDDDPASLKVCQTHLEKAGFSVTPAFSGAQAIEAIQSRGPGSFLAVLADQMMPQMSGLELLEWIKQIDNALSVIMVTARNESTLVRDSLRHGATDFLEKPVSGKLLVDATARACDQTLRARQLNTAQKNVRAVAQMNHFFKSILVDSIKPYLQLHYTPFDQVGGDFVNVLPVDENRVVMMAGDVSGHDLRAGFVSAYFQGLARGLCRDGKGVLEICREFNNILVEEWNRRGTMHHNPFSAEPRTTLSLLAVELNFAKDEATVVNCGAPGLKISRLCGCTEIIRSANPPLGWTNTEPLESKTVSLKNAGYLFLATDGLHDWAEKLGTNSLALAYRLLQKRSTPGGTPPDDLLIFRYQHHRGISSEELWHPLVHLENPEETAAAELLQKLHRTLKYNSQNAPSLEELSAALGNGETGLLRCCASVLPKDDSLKVMAELSTGQIIEKIFSK